MKSEVDNTLLGKSIPKVQREEFFPYKIVSL